MVSGVVIVGVNLVPKGAPTPQYSSPPKGQRLKVPSEDCSYFFYYYRYLCFCLYHYKAESK
jgi:hypothetical protein